MARRVGAHVAEGDGLGLALEASEEGHVAGEVLDVLGGQRGTAVHPREVVHAVDAVGLDPLAHEAAGPQRLGDLLVGPAQHPAARIAHRRIDRVTKPVSTLDHRDLPSISHHAALDASRRKSSVAIVRSSQAPITDAATPPQR